MTRKVRQSSIFPSRPLCLHTKPLTHQADLFNALPPFFFFFSHSCAKTEHKKQREFMNVSRPAILFDEFLLQSFGKEEFSQFDELFPSGKKLLRICYPAITS
jgi:hypothetical protein